MANLHLTRGVPASGKTTYAQFWVASGPRRVRVSRDDLRMELFGVYWGPDVDENIITKVQHSRIKTLLENDFDVVVDDTNLRAKTVKALLKVAQEAGAYVTHEDFPVTLEQAISRDETRSVQGGRTVGVEVIKGFFNRFMGKGGKFPAFPVLDEPTVQFAPYVEQEGLPHAILVDIDGTLAHMEGRSPYDPTLYHTDKHDRVISDIAEAYAGITGCWVFIMSGRDEAYNTVTREWLVDNGIDYDRLYMRPEGDTRNDAIVKNELFEKHIAGKYNVDFVLDDRDRVVKMWRAKGLKVLQVAEGDF